MKHAWITNTAFTKLTSIRSVCLDCGQIKGKHDKECPGEKPKLAPGEHGCKDCGEERVPRIVAGRLTCPECGSENIVCIS